MKYRALGIFACFLFIASFQQSASASCGLLLESHPSNSNNKFSISPQDKYKAYTQKGVLYIEDKSRTLALNFESKLPHPEHLDNLPVEYSWSPNEDKLIVIPTQFDGQSSFNFFIVDISTESWDFKSVSLPKKTTTTQEVRGLQTQQEQSIWFSGLNKFAIRAKLRSKGLKTIYKEVLLVFNNDNRLDVPIGFRIDPGYRIASIYQDENNPQIIDVQFYHTQYYSTFVERWDLNQSLKIAESYLYVPYGESGFKEIPFAPNFHPIVPTAEERGAPQEIKSPNGKYWIRLTVDQSPFGGEQYWAMDMVKHVPARSDDRPFKLALLESIPTEISFDRLKLYWHNRGEALIVRTNFSQVWLWSSQTKHKEVFTADDFKVINHKLYLFKKTEKGTQTTVFSLKTYETIK